MPERTLVLEKPIDITSVNKPQFLFYLAGQTPLSVDEFADDCTSTFVRSNLTDRFGMELRLDRADHIRLTGEARRPIIEASKPVLETTRQLLSRGDALFDEAEYAQAANRLSKSIVLLETIYDKLSAVDHESTTVTEHLTTARKKHDHAIRESTKDSINYHVLQARNHESRGDEQRENNPSAAVSEYRKAKQAFENAIGAAKEYNDSRVHNASAALSVDPLSDQLESITNKMSAVDRPGEESDSPASTPNLGSKTVDSTDDTDDTDGANDDTEEAETTGTVSLEEVQSDIPGFGRAKRISLKLEGYETLADIAGSSKRDLTNVNRIGPQAAERLLSVADSGRARDASTDNVALSTDTDTATPDASTTDTTQRTTSEQAEPPYEASRASSRNPQVDPSAFENSWEGITKSRIDGQFLAKVTDIKTPRGDRKSETVVVVDREGKEVELDVWKTHEVDIDWSVGEWYALIEATGNVWQTDDGHTKKRLSTTSDFKILRLGPDFDPTTPGGEHLPGTADEGTESQTETRATSAMSSTNDDGDETGEHSEVAAKQGESTGENADDDGIFADIVSDFDELG